MDYARSKLHVDEMHYMGFTGKNITAAVLDTGICPHPDYVRRILAFQDFVNRRSGMYDDASHGSHVTGILAGDGNRSCGRYRGIAPECNIIHLKILDRYGQGKLSNILEAMDWVLENKERYHIRIMNLSAGTSKEEEDQNAVTLVQAVENVWDAGIVVTVAAGNMGPEQGSITVPGNSRKVITVGAYDEFKMSGLSTDHYYSGCGPTGECICKPDLVAPGANVRSCSTRWRRGISYGTKSGTSMASPMVAGAAALLLEKEPFLTNVEVKMRMKEAAKDMGLPRNRQGWGMLDVKRLLRIE